MTKFEVIIAKLARLETENKAQTKSIDSMHTTVAQHIQSSEPFRIQCSKNVSNISWLKRGILSLFGIVGGIGVWLVRSILLK